MLPSAANAANFRRWDRLEVTVRTEHRTRREIWDGSRPLADFPLVDWQLRRGRKDIFAVTPDGTRKMFYRVADDLCVLVAERDGEIVARVEVKTHTMPAAVFSPQRSVSPSEAICATRFHVFCGTGDTLLADRAVGALFRGSVDDNEVLILLRKGTQTFVYTKVEGLMLHVRSGRILAFPPGQRFEVAADVIERGVFRWESYWWRVAVVR